MAAFQQCASHGGTDKTSCAGYERMSSHEGCAPGRGLKEKQVLGIKPERLVCFFILTPEVAPDPVVV
ncbi:hypothetical protein AA19596_2060 [Acetobacter fabarum DSM 19596]|jgi:hypothetical protein|nr:hypothetical protein AA19596_2060 [Acetobacter fabarum DSM 19596]